METQTTTSSPPLSPPGNSSGKIRISPDLEGANHSCQEFVVDDAELMYHIWEPASSQSSPALVVLMHGLGDHILHMMTVVEYMIKKMNLIVCGFDQRGHGDSPGPRGHLSNWEIFRSDLTLFCDVLAQKFPKLPIFLFGNSMGGLCVLDYVMHVANPNIKGVITNAPALTLQDLKAGAGGFVWMCSKVAPSFALSANLNSAKLTRDVSKQQENDADYLIHTKASMKLLDQMNQAGRWVKNHPNKLQQPFLLLQGTSDPIVSPNDNINFQTNVKKTNPNADIYKSEGGMHELFNETDRDNVFEHCRLFIERCLGQE